MLQPAEGRYKVYILDEAHQLTSQAWNALLKLIEEPPAPRPSSAPPTSRRSSNGAPALPTIVFERPQPRRTSSLSCATSATAKESTRPTRRWRSSHEVPAVVPGRDLDARPAVGGDREGRSPCKPYSNWHGRRGGHAVRALRHRSSIATPRARSSRSRSSPSGAGPRLSWSRSSSSTSGSCCSCSTSGHVPGSLPSTEETRDRLREQANQLPEPTVLRLIDLLAVAVDDMRQGGDPRLPLELALVKVTRPQADLPRESLAHRVELLEQRPHGGPTAGPAEPARSTSIAATTTAPSGRRRNRPAGGGACPATLPSPELSTAPLQEAWTPAAMLRRRQERSIPIARSSPRPGPSRSAATWSRSSSQAPASTARRSRTRRTSPAPRCPVRGDRAPADGRDRRAARRPSHDRAERTPASSPRKT